MTKEEMNKDEWYVILNMNCKYEICRMCPKSGLFKGSYEECENWIKQKKKEEIKDEMKDRISMALKAPVLQQGFEIICKENAELKTKVTALENANRAMVKELDDMTSGGVSVLKNIVRSKEQLTKAKELIKRYVKIYVNPYPEEEVELRNEAEQFLNSEVEK